MQCYELRHLEENNGKGSTSKTLPGLQLHGREQKALVGRCRHLLLAHYKNHMQLNNQLNPEFLEPHQQGGDSFVPLGLEARGDKILSSENSIVSSKLRRKTSGRFRGVRLIYTFIININIQG